MNTIDIKNIKKEIAKRKANAYVFETGGELSKDEIVNSDTEILNKMIKDFSNLKKETANEKIKKLVDEIFEKYAEPESNDNLIILGACNYYDDSRCVATCDNPLRSIDFDGFGHRYNKLAYPIGRYYDLEHYDRFEQKYVEGADDGKYAELSKLTQKIEALLPDIGLTSIERYWDDNSDALNEMWYGVHAITKDYKIVAFVIRNDGMLCDEDSFDSFHNNILYRL